jgi:ubiquinone/menaquinone biosynthesis C-methylase UbiE
LSHKFNVKNKSKLDNPWRRENFPPDKILQEIGISNEDIFGDIGCGIGYFTIPATKIVQEVYAFDISKEMLDDIELQKNENNIENLNLIQSKEYDLVISDEKITFGLIVNVIHEIEDKLRFLQECKRIIKANGKLIIIEWKKESMEIGPPVDHRISEDEVRGLLKKGGFSIDKKIDFNDEFYGIIATK